MMAKTPKSSPRARWRVWAACLAVVAGTVGAGGMVGSVVAGTTTEPVASDNHAVALDAFRKARALYTQGNYADADAANNRALQLEPTLNEAKLLRKVLREKVGNGASTTGGGVEEPATPSTGPAKVRALTMEQVSMIRLQELSAADTQIRGRVPRKALDGFWNTYMKNQAGADLSQAAYNAFINPGNFMGQVHAIKESNLQQFAENVDIASDPANMMAFRTAVEPYVLQTCATSACHGGDKAGNFHLLRPGGASIDQVIYTNFYIMSQYTTKDGGMVINRDDPNESIFLQYGLPRTVAHHAHPVEIRPRFGDTKAPEYQIMAAWVKSLAYPRPNYGVVYEIPGMTAAATTAPATTTPK
jgi:hypothetical protein